MESYHRTALSTNAWRLSQIRATALAEQRTYDILLAVAFEKWKVYSWLEAVRS